MRSRSQWLMVWFASFAALVAAGNGARAGGLPCVQPPAGARPEYRIETDLGTIVIRLFDQPGEAPNTVQNFLNYAERGDYDGSFWHRLAAGFVLQGGGFRYAPGPGYQQIPTDPPVANEPGICNIRGTLAMAKVGGDPNSATNQFFINLIDNTQTLGSQNGGFTVFAQVLPADLNVVDALAVLTLEYGPLAIDDPLGPAFVQLPVLEALPHDPAGYGPNGCLKVSSGVLIHPTQGPIPNATNTCPDTPSLQLAIAAHRAAMEPEVPERLVRVISVPEPGAGLLLAAGAATLAAARIARRRTIS